MKRIFTIVSGLLITVASVRALPPPSPKLEDLVAHSDFIAIVAVTNVRDHVSARVAWKTGPRQSAIAIVKRTLKGPSVATVRLTHHGSPLQITCRAPNLASGEFLVFLKRDGTNFVRTDRWYSQALITTNYVRLGLEQPVALESAITSIEKILSVK